MAIAADVIVPAPSHSASLDLNCSPEEVFALLCSVEKWPVWLSMLRSARRPHDDGELRVGSEVVIRSSLPGEEEQWYEVDALIPSYRLSLVGAFSMRRRWDFRIEQKSSSARLHVHISYPAYHGRVGKMLDHWQRGRRISSALDVSLVHFKGLVEYRRDAAVLADF
ncbi:MAG: SRPBCC family protein [Candidatus Eremiobacteraeota bacterium]|nr:SRPBCC family protein [Candidatus Eremiobacteraeota bacterium]